MQVNTTDGLFGERCRHVAVSARQELTEFRVDSALLVRLYVAYHPVPDAALFVERALGMFPKLCCGLSSVYLRYRLGEGMAVQGFFGDERHTFLLARGLVVDITADQYGGPRVYVGGLAAPWCLASRVACTANADEATLGGACGRRTSGSS